MASPELGGFWRVLVTHSFTSEIETRLRKVSSLVGLAMAEMREMAEQGRDCRLARMSSVDISCNRFRQVNLDLMVKSQQTGNSCV